MLEASAFEIGFEPLSDISRQRPVVRREPGIVFLDQSIEKGALGTVALVDIANPAQTGFPARHGLHHVRVLAKQV